MPDWCSGPKFTNVIYDAHWYQVHDHNEFDGKSVEFNLQYPRNRRIPALRLLERGNRLVIIGKHQNGSSHDHQTV